MHHLFEQTAADLGIRTEKRAPTLLLEDRLPREAIPGIHEPLIDAAEAAGLLELDR